MPHDESLTVSELAKLEWLEKVIREGKDAFVEVGKAIMEIRESRLYRRDYSTFEAYCQGKWGWGIKRAQQLARAAQFWDKQKQIGAPLPENERQARKMRMETKKETCGRPQNLEYVGTENDKEDKPMATARKIPGADHGHTTPPPMPVASTVRPSVSPALFNEIHAIVNYIKRVESKEPSLSDSQGFRHIVTLIQNLESRVQILLPGMETVCASEGKPKSRATLEQLREFCVSLNLPADDGDWFYDKMLQHGWKVDGKPVNDVYATIRNWNRMNIMCSQKQNSYGKTNALTGKNSNGRNSLPDYSKGF